MSSLLPVKLYIVYDEHAWKVMTFNPSPYHVYSLSGLTVKGSWIGVASAVCYNVEFVDQPKEDMEELSLCVLWSRSHSFPLS